MGLQQGYCPRQNRGGHTTQCGHGYPQQELDGCSRQPYQQEQHGYLRTSTHDGHCGPERGRHVASFCGGSNTTVVQKLPCVVNFSSLPLNYLVKFCHENNGCIFRKVMRMLTLSCPVGMKWD